MLPPLFFVCAACGSVVTLDSSPGYRCPRRSGDSSDDAHRLLREIDPTRLHWPDLGPENPLLRYRQLTSAYLRFRLAGGSDADYIEGVEELEANVEATTGARFLSSQVLRSEALELATGRDSPGAVFVQDRSRFAGGPGSWQALVFALVPEWFGLDSHPLVTFERADDSPDVLRLAQILGREVGFSEAAPYTATETPWTGWRDLNAWVMEGEELWAFGAVDAMRRTGRQADRVFLCPDGRGAAGWVLGVRESFRLGGLPALPRVHIVEDLGREAVGFRYDAVVRRILAQVDERLTDPVLLSMASRFSRVRQAIADRIVTGLRSGETDHPVRRAVEASLRVEAEPGREGVDHQDLLVRGMVESGGFPLAVDGDEVIRGRMLSRREAPGTAREAEGTPPSLRTPGLASAGMLRLFSHGDLPKEEVLLVVDP